MFFRPNYERGILIDSMVKRYKPKSLLEIGIDDLKLPKNKLQLEEVDQAMFMSKDESIDKIFWRQSVIMENV